MYNILYSNNETNQTIFAYGPLFPESPTSSDVALASIEYFVKLTSKLGQKATVITADQAIYDIIQGIRKKHTGKFDNLVVRLGGFHIAENFLGAIGFIIKNSGIEDIFVESGMSKRGTANKVIGGKDYYKMMRYHSLVSEAMIGLMWSASESFVEEEGLSEAIESLQNHVAMFAQTLEDNDADQCKIHTDEIKSDCFTPSDLGGVLQQSRNDSKVLDDAHRYVSNCEKIR